MITLDRYGVYLTLDSRGVEPGSVTVTGADGTVYPGDGTTTAWDVNYRAGKIEFNNVADDIPLETTVNVDFLPASSRFSPHPALRTVPRRRARRRRT